MKKRYLFSLVIFFMSVFMMASVAMAEGNMNVATICATDDAKNSAAKMEKVLASNKLSLWRLNKRVSYYFDCDKRPSTRKAIDNKLDSAFGSSTNQDINYLYIASHGYAGTNEANKVVYANTGLMIDGKGGEENGLYKFTDLVGKLVKYKGQFVVIIDCCYAENFYTAGLRAYPKHAGRFTVFCSAPNNETAWGAGPILHTQFYTSSLVKALTYKSSKNCYPADANNDGFISVKELFQTQRMNILARTYGNEKTLLFQFGYLKLSKQAVTVNLADKKTYNLASSLKKYNCSGRQIPKWKSSDTAVATVNSSGKVTLKKAGTVTITAYLADSKGNMCLGSEASCKITVNAPTVKLNKTKVTLYKGQTLKLNATITGTKKKPSWSSNKNVATVNSKGKITAKKAGTATIKVSVNGISASCEVTVRNPSISLSSTNVTLNVGEKITLTPKVSGASQRVSWSSKKSSIASVSSGTVTAKKVGTTTITAKANGVSATCKVTVVNADPRDLSQFVGTRARNLPFKTSTFSAYARLSGSSNIVYAHYNSKSKDRITEMCLNAYNYTSKDYNIGGIYPGMTVKNAKAALTKYGWKLSHQKTHMAMMPITYYIYTKQGKAILFAVVRGDRVSDCITCFSSLNAALKGHSVAGVPCGCYWQKW